MRRRLRRFLFPVALMQTGMVSMMRRSIAGWAGSDAYNPCAWYQRQGAAIDGDHISDGD